MTQVAAQQPPAPKVPKAPPATSATKTTGGARTVALTGGDDMKFSVTEITAKPGETIHIQLKNVGTIPKMAMARQRRRAQADDEGRGLQHRCASARDTDFIPAAMKAEVVAFTPLAGPGETVEITFKVPAAAGTHPLHVHLPRALHRRHEGNPSKQPLLRAGYSSVAGTHLA